jgi:Heterokaryon incompatibility protein (HET)
MVLNGRTFYVSKSVHDILRQGRGVFSSRLIWVDSVCINQEDPKEKSHQVRKMQVIYAKATRVTVCLGDSPDAALARAFGADFVCACRYLRWKGMDECDRRALHKE